jgi:hypothetical protein
MFGFELRELSLELICQKSFSLAFAQNIHLGPPLNRRAVAFKSPRKTLLKALVIRTITSSDSIWMVIQTLCPVGMKPTKSLGQGPIALSLGLLHMCNIPSTSTALGGICVVEHTGAGVESPVTLYWLNRVKHRHYIHSIWGQTSSRSSSQARRWSRSSSRHVARGDRQQQ